jgi:hypothetical protein
MASPTRQTRPGLVLAGTRSPLSAPQGEHLCNSLTCVNADQVAEVAVTFGTLADPDSGRDSKDALWPATWGRTYPMCAPCRHRTCQVAGEHRPNLVIREIGCLSD